MRATAYEVPTIVDDLIRRYAIAPQIGVAGWSMGGFIAHSAVIADPRVRVAMPMIGSPEWRLPWPDSPHLHPERFFLVALLSQTAREDTRIPAHFARAFHHALEPYYIGEPERRRYVEYEGVNHTIPASVKEKMRQRMVDWFTRYLIAAR